MELGYYKRFRMEIDLAGRKIPAAELPPSYRLLAWDSTLLEAFAAAKFASFRHEMDANVFPCLGEMTGCRRLMHEIIRKPGFLPQATWLLSYTHPLQRRVEYIGTIQGVRDRNGMGAIQNLGVAPHHRNLRLGSMLLDRAFEGFQAAGLSRVHLEVTAQNEAAIRLYRRIGFTVVKTVFKPAEPVYS
jgi:hypothetical protein